MTRDELNKLMANYTGEVKKLPTLTEEEQKQRRKHQDNGYRNDVTYRYHPTFGEVAFNSEGEPIC